jgi:hypothetical protein
MSLVTYNALLRILPTEAVTNQCKLRALVGGLPLVQVIGNNRTLTFRDPADNNFLGFNPTASQKLTILPSAVTQPTIIHIEQDEFPGNSALPSGSKLEWRKILVVYSDTTNPPNLASSSSTLCFSYPDPGDFDMLLEGSADNTRPLFPSIVGRSEAEDPATRIFGGGGRTWNMLLTLRDSPVTFDLNANQTLRLLGGIRSNSSVIATPSTSAVVLERNTNPGALELFSDRMGWIETWRQ